MILKLILKIVKYALFIIFIFSLFLISYELYTTYKLRKFEIKINKKENMGKPNSLSLITFNTWGLPIWIPGIDKPQRYKHIPLSILSTHADIICLQEVFDFKLRNLIIETLSNNKYHFNQTYLPKNKSFLIEKNRNGGLMTFSKYPLLWEKFFPHKLDKNMKFDEKMGEKGFLISFYKTPWGELGIINIHLNAGRRNIDEEIRLKQIKHLYQTLSNLHLLKKNLILQGDLNITHQFINEKNDHKNTKSSVYTFLTNKLGFIDTKPIITENDISYDGKNNKYAFLFYNRFEKQQKFDYCLFKFSNIQLIKSNSKTIFKKPFPISDHYAIFTELILNEP